MDDNLFGSGFLRYHSREGSRKLDSLAPLRRREKFLLKPLAFGTRKLVPDVLVNQIVLDGRNAREILLVRKSTVFNLDLLLFGQFTQ
jgi:hypothetical protein